MSQVPNIDGVLIQWGDRLFYRGNRIVKVKPEPKLSGLSERQRAAAIPSAHRSHACWQPLVKPLNLVADGLTAADFDRLSVAYGLSAADCGGIELSPPVERHRPMPHRPRPEAPGMEQC